MERGRLISLCAVPFPFVENRPFYGAVLLCGQHAGGGTASMGLDFLQAF